MNERSQNLGFGLSWLIGTLTLVYVIPHTKVSAHISQQFFGKTPSTGEWVSFLLAHLAVAAILWIGMSFYHVVIRDGEEQKVAEGSGPVMYGIILGLAAILILGPKYLFPTGKMEWYVRLAGFVLIAGLIILDFFTAKKSDEQARSLFDSVSLGLAWSAVTAIIVTLFLSLCSTGKAGTLRAFIYDLARNKTESKILYAYIAVFLLVALLVLGNRSIRALFRKELRLYFTTPTAYAVIGLFSVISSVFFNLYFAHFDRSQMMYKLRARRVVLNLNDSVFQGSLRTLGVIMLFMVPIITMRLLAAEKKERTHELLMTAPITTTDIIISKYLSAMAVLFTMLFVTFLYPLALGWMEPGSFEWAPLFTGYFGLLLLAGAFAGIGLLCSSFSEDQMVAAATSFGILMLLWLVGALASFTSAGWFRETVQYLSILSHLQGFTKGVLSNKDIVYYVSFIFFSTFLAHRVVESQRWS